jgi:hypothetical protein
MEPNVNPHVLYVFDFDDTLVRVVTKVRIFDKTTNETIEMIQPAYFIEFYEPKENEGAEYIDSDKYTKMPYLNILKDAISKFGGDLPNHVWICTARYDATPVNKILKKEGIGSIPIAAVGTKEKANDTGFHAGRKKAFVSALIKRVKPGVVYFYDDSFKNLAAVGSLAKKYNVTIVLVNTTDHKLTRVTP